MAELQTNFLELAFILIMLFMYYILYFFVLRHLVVIQ